MKQKMAKLCQICIFLLNKIYHIKKLNHNFFSFTSKLDKKQKTKLICIFQKRNKRRRSLYLENCRVPKQQFQCHVSFTEKTSISIQNLYLSHFLTCFSILKSKKDSIIYIYDFADNAVLLKFWT